MSGHDIHLNCKLITVRLAVLMVVVGMTISAFAGIGLAPVPDASNTNAIEQARITQFYEAKKSHEEKLKVGRERYANMLAHRAEVLQVMANELAERQKTVVIEPPAPVENTEKSQVQTQNYTLIGIIIIGLAFLGFRHYLNWQEAKDAVANYPGSK